MDLIPNPLGGPPARKLRVWAAAGAAITIGSSRPAQRLEPFLAALPDIAFSHFTHQQRLLDHLAYATMPDVLVLHHALPGPFQPQNYLDLVHRLAPYLRIIYLAAGGVAPQYTDFERHRTQYILPASADETDLLLHMFQLPAYDPGLPANPPRLRRRNTCGHGPLPQLIAFWSPSGIGATTLVVHTALYLARHFSDQIIAVDFNWATPSLGFAFNILPYRNPYSHCLSHLLPLADARRLTPAAIQAHLLHHSVYKNLGVLPGVLYPHALPRVTAEHVQNLLDALTRIPAVVLIDLAPAFDALTTFLTLEKARRVVIVTSPKPSCKFHLTRSLAQLHYLQCPFKHFSLALNCAQAADVQRLPPALGVPVAAIIPQIPPARFSPGLPSTASDWDNCPPHFSESIAGLVCHLC